MSQSRIKSIIIVYFYYLPVSFSIVISANSSLNSLISCTKSIADTYWYTSQHIAVFHNLPRDDTFIDQLLEYLTTEKVFTVSLFGYKLNNGEHKKSIPEKVNHFVVVIQNQEEFYAFLVYIEESYVWNSRGKFVIVVTNSVSSKAQSKTVKDVLSELWKKLIINIVVLISPIVNNTNLQIYTWYPFAPSGNCGRNVENMIVIDEWIVDKQGYFKYNIDLYPMKVPYKFQGCTITASTMHLAPYAMLTNDSSIKHNSKYYYDNGIEVRLFKTVVEASGLKIKYIDPPSNHPVFGRFGGMLSNGTWIGLLGNVVNKEADVTFCGFRMTDERLKVLDISEVYLRDSWLWHLQRPKRIPHWKSLIIIFSKEIWILLFICYIMQSFVFYLLSTAGNREKMNSNMIMSALTSWSVLIGISLKCLPKSTKFRIVFVLWVWFSLLIIYAYQTILISALTNPGHEKEIKTVEELLESGLDFGGPVHIRKLFDGQNDYISKTIYDNFIPCDTFEKCFDRLVYDGDYAVLDLYLKSEYSGTITYVDSSGNFLFNRMKDAVLSFDCVMFLRRGSHYVDNFINIIKRIKSGGILQKWWKDMGTINKLKNLSQNTHNDKEDVILTLLHLEGAFGIFILGSVISIFVFILELLYEKKNALCYV